ncbi:helix-turn-helix domain-containing protein [Flavobacterium sp.]|uniref:helix-turn-helix domain-containing protein n=1 Tax=Flavobacterium sp. TaxID=239 RepID=UPI0037C072EC
MAKEILQIENINASDFKKEILSDFTGALQAYASSLQNPDKDTLLTRQQTADLLGVSLVSLWEWTRKDIIPAFRIGNKVRYKKLDVLESLQKMNQLNS